MGCCSFYTFISFDTISVIPFDEINPCCIDLVQENEIWAGEQKENNLLRAAPGCRINALCPLPVLKWAEPELEVFRLRGSRFYYTPTANKEATTAGAVRVVLLS